MTTATLCGPQILQLQLKAVERSRASTSLGDFLVAQSRINLLLRTHNYAVADAVGRGRPPPPLGARALLSQLEEIYCDVMPIMMMAAGDDTPRSGLHIFRTMQHVIDVAAHGHGAAARLKEQRGYRPRALEGVDLDATAALAPEWEGVGPRLMPALKAVAGGDLDTLESQATETPLGAPTPKECQSEHRETALHILRLTQDHERVERLAAAHAAVARFPYSASLHLELAIALDQSGRPAEALPEATASVCLDPSSFLAWRSLAVVLGRCGAQNEADVAWARLQVARTSRRPLGSPGTRIATVLGARDGAAGDREHDVTSAVAEDAA